MHTEKKPGYTTQPQRTTFNSFAPTRCRIDYCIFPTRHSRETKSSVSQAKNNFTQLARLSTILSPEDCLKIMLMTTHVNGTQRMIVPICHQNEPMHCRRNQWGHLNHKQCPNHGEECVGRKVENFFTKNFSSFNHEQVLFNGSTV